MKILLTSLFVLFSLTLFSQRRKPADVPDGIQVVDTMIVNLYTDSLKRGTYNYINIIGKLNNGRFIPLDSARVLFRASDGTFYGNSLWIAPEFNKEKVTITVTLKDDPRQTKTLEIYIKKAPDPELKTKDQIMH